MKKRRIVITGMGLVSCFGSDIDEFYDKLLKGESGITPIESFDCSEYSTRFAGEIKKVDTEGYLDKKQARRVDPYIRYTMVAGNRAIENAGFDKDSLNKERVGVIIGSGMGGMHTFEDGVHTLANRGLNRLTPFFIPYVITNMGGALLAMDHGFMGPNYSISTACATANYSIVSAANHIRNGDADVMICGGAEAPLTPVGVAGFVVIKALSTRNESPKTAARPWDKSRDGFVMGEGSGVLVLESLEHALARGANILAEYHGGAYSCDAYHMTSPREDGSGVALCIENAIKDAGIDREEINYVNAHATCTPVGDLCEIRAMKKVFGEDQIQKMAINATKSITGHCLGAAAAIEAVATIKAIMTGKVHPTLNCHDPEDEVEGLDLVRDGVKEMEITAAASNSFGFGGHNSTVIFGPYNG